jgi:hypothetical protein
MTSQPTDFFSQIQELCSYAGVKAVHTPCLPKAPIHGSTRWLNDIPLVLLSGVTEETTYFGLPFFTRLDIFYFTVKNIFQLKILNTMEKTKFMKMKLTPFRQIYC